MVLVAQIIVDVPLMQTDRPYSYLIPEAMQGQIAIGMRVHVPFGKSSIARLCHWLRGAGGFKRLS